jgi:predicted O-methyltransferase YrrM
LGIKRFVQRSIAAQLERRVGQRPALSLPWSVFTLVPPAYWQTVSDGILAPSESAAVRLLTHRHQLKELLGQADLSNSAAITPITIIEIWRLLNSNRPRVIVELGCGVSTRIFAHYARQCERMEGVLPKVYSIEHSPEWLDIVTRRLADCGLASYVTMIEAPLEKAEIDGIQSHCYAPEALARIPAESVDFCLIDGPPAVHEPLNRLGCLPLMFKYLAEGCTVILDDTARQGERQAIAHWRHMYAGQLHQLVGVFSSAGFASFTWTAPRQSR